MRPKLGNASFGRTDLGAARIGRALEMRRGSLSVVNVKDGEVVSPALRELPCARRSGLKR